MWNLATHVKLGKPYQRSSTARTTHSRYQKLHGELFQWISWLTYPPQRSADKKFNSFVVFVDLLSKMCHLVPTKTTVNGEGVARIYFEQINRLHGLPRGLV